MEVDNMQQKEDNKELLEISQKYLQKDSYI